MSPNELELLRRAVALSEENNDILRSMRRSMRLARFMSILYWVFIIGSAIGAYYFIQPYLGNLLNVYTGGVGGTSNISDVLKNLNNKEQMKELLDTIK